MGLTDELNFMRLAFNRAVKRMTGRPLAVEDLQNISCLTEFGDTFAEREGKTEYWSTYTRVGFGTEHKSHGLTTQEACDWLAGNQTVNGRDINVPYNHFSRVRQMLEAKAPNPS